MTHEVTVLLSDQYVAGKRVLVSGPHTADRFFELYSKVAFYNTILGI